jgi:hypothetical protein
MACGTETGYKKDGESFREVAAQTFSRVTIATV